ncbi:hypothetical protein H0H92_014027, partial [Tricholoma furcatifolium]
MATPSSNTKTPVHSHPLSSDDTASVASSRTRRSRTHTQTQTRAHGQPTSSSSSSSVSPTNYHSVRAQLEADSARSGGANWDGSVRGYAKNRKSGTQKDLSTLWNNHPNGTSPLFVLGSSRDALLSSPRNPEVIVTDAEEDHIHGAAVTEQVLAHKWHEYTDEGIHAAISHLGGPDVPTEVVSDPYNAALRVLSSAVHNLTRVRRELEESRRALVEREGARRERASQLLKELGADERDVAIARRVVECLFADAPVPAPTDGGGGELEAGHLVKRQQSSMSLTESLSEALSDDASFAPSSSLNTNSHTLTTMPEEPESPSTPPPPPSPLPELEPESDSTTLVSDSQATPTIADTPTPVPTPIPEPPADSELENPSRPERERPSWMGTWWGTRSKSKSRTGSTRTKRSSSNSSTPTEPDKDPPPPLPSNEPNEPNGPTDNDAAETVVPLRRGSGAGARRTAKSVFGSLGITLLGSASTSSVGSSTKPLDSTSVHTTNSDADVGETETKTEAEAEAASVHSTRTTSTLPMLSTAPSTLASPMQPTFASTLAAPQLTTSTSTSTSLSLPSTDADAPLAPSQSNADNTAPPSIPQGTSLRAIANSTRIMTTEPASVLVDHGRYTAPRIAQGAWDLVVRARDEGVVFREPARPRAGAGAGSGGAVGTLSRALGVQQGGQGQGQGQGQVDGGIGTQKLTQTQTQKKTKSRTPSLRSPLFGSFLPIHPPRQLQRKPTPSATGPGGGGAPDSKATNANTSTSSEAEPIVVRKAPASVPLESIIPATAKPPTQYLGAFARTYTPLTSRAFEFHLSTPQNATRFLHASSHDASSQDTSSHGHSPMTDRYGFAYDVALYDFLLLLRAREARCVAPACLTGVKIADREEDNMWPEPEPDDGDGEGEEEEGVEIVKVGCSCDGESPPPPASKVDGAEEAQTQPDADAGSIKAPSTKSTKSRASSSKSKSKNTPSLGRKRSPTVTASTLGPQALSSILRVTPATPRHLCANTIRRLLDELTGIHDARQAAQRREWDAFLRVRSASGATAAAGA